VDDVLKLTTIDFGTFIDTPNVKQTYDKAVMEGEAIQKAIDGCPYRTKGAAYMRGTVACESGTCKRQSDILGWVAGLERKCCALCQAHGGGDVKDNAYLLWHAKHCIYAVLLQNPADDAAKEPADVELADKAILAAKNLTNKETALQLATGCVVTGRLTPEDAAAIADKHGLVEDTIDDGGQTKSLA